MKPLLLGTMLLLLASAAQAATITGTVYDFGLSPVPQALVIAEGPVKQQVIADDAAYGLDVPAGSYLIRAQQWERGRVIALAEENITVPAAGTYRLDLIVFPLFEEEELMETEIPVDDMLTEAAERPIFPYVVLAALAIAGAGITAAIILRKGKKHAPEAEEAAPEARTGTKAGGKPDGTETEGKTAGSATLPADLQQVVDFIAAEGGRTTQKELRKQFPLSEAKISLMLADLEQRGVIRKIKKGRGNVVVMEGKA